MAISLVVGPGPLVTRAEIRLHTRGEVLDDDPDDGDLEAVLAEGGHHDVRRCVGVRGAW